MLIRTCLRERMWIVEAKMCMPKRELRRMGRCNCKTQ